MGCYFQEPPIVAVVVTKIPFVFIIKVFGEYVYCLLGGHMRFAFDEDGAGGIGQSQGDVLVVVEVDEFLGVSAGGDEDAAVEPDIPERRQVGTAVLTHGCQPYCCFPPQAGFDGTPPCRILSFHRDVCPLLPVNHRYASFTTNGGGVTMLAAGKRRVGKGNFEAASNLTRLEAPACLLVRVPGSRTFVVTFILDKVYSAYNGARLYEFN